MLNMKPNLHDAQQNQFSNTHQNAEHSHTTNQRQSETTKSNKSNSSLGILPGRLNHPKEMTLQARRAYDNSPVQIDLTYTDIIGKGTFGQIECAMLTLSEEGDKNSASSAKEPLKVAVKQVLQDPRYKNRELSIMQRLRNHSNIVSFYYYYYSTSKGSSTNRSSRSSAANEGNSDVNIYLHLVLECFPESLCDLIFRYSQQSHSIPNITVKLFTYQMLKALGYLHSHSICHRDIKSSNLLVNEQTLVLKVCDFGSAKEMTPGSTNVSYISSRYYRAPELLFGAQSYTCAIDTWSAGCVLAEMLRLYCLFAGTDSVDQLVKVIRVLGTPTVDEILSMNPLYDTYNFPNVEACPVQIYFPIHTPVDMLNLMNQMLVYNPTKRITPRNALNHECFKDIKSLGPKGVLPNRIPMPPHIFDPDPEKVEAKKDDDKKGSNKTSTNSSQQCKESKSKTPPNSRDSVKKKSDEKGLTEINVNEEDSK